MLEAYRKLEALGVIGRMMKVDVNGKEIVDFKGDVPGNMIARPFQEFPKVVRRFRRDGTLVETIVNSKNEELRLIAESPDEVMGIPLSPLERERDELAQQNAAQGKALDAMQRQVAEMMEKMTKLSQALDQRNANEAALGTGSSPQPTRAQDAEAKTAPLTISSPSVGKSAESEATKVAVKK